MNLKLSPRGLVIVLSAAAGLVILLHVVAFLPVIFMGRENPLGYLALDGEHNLPTIFSVALLWCNALLAGCIAGGVFKQRGAWAYWCGMALLFVIAGVDESTELHERATDIVALFINATGLLYFAWVVPYLAFLLMLGIIFARFMFSLPKDTQKYLLLAGLLFFTGAIGFEMLGGMCIELHGRNAHYNIYASCEEVLEMAGCIVSVYALSNHISRHLPGLCLKISSADEERFPAKSRDA